ncbi:MAG: DUF6452 family protein [Nonlabens sp.]
MRQLIALLVLFAALTSCERDDLCIQDQPTSPRLVIVFKDAIDQVSIKTVPSLQVTTLGSNTPAPLDFAGTQTITAADTIALPLRNSFDLTSYNFLNTEDNSTQTSSIDFNAMRQEEFISRACGFRTLYSELTATAINPDTGWIRGINVVNTSVQSNNVVHVEIFH